MVFSFISNVNTTKALRSKAKAKNAGLKTKAKAAQCTAHHRVQTAIIKIMYTGIYTGWMSSVHIAVDHLLSRRHNMICASVLLLLLQLRARSKAAEAGLMEGDEVLAVNGYSCKDVSYDRLVGLVEHAGHYLDLDIVR